MSPRLSSRAVFVYSKPVVCCLSAAVSSNYSKLVNNIGEHDGPSDLGAFSLAKGTCLSPFYKYTSSKFSPMEEEGL